MTPSLNRVVRHGLLVGTHYRDRGIGQTVINEQQSSTSGKAVTRSMKALITSASLKQAATTHTCSLAINARSALFEIEGLPAQS